MHLHFWSISWSCLADAIVPERDDFVAIDLKIPLNQLDGITRLIVTRSSILLMPCYVLWWKYMVLRLEWSPKHNRWGHVLRVMWQKIKWCNSSKLRRQTDGRTQIDNTIHLNSFKTTITCRAATEANCAWGITPLVYRRHLLWDKNKTRL